jgi:hypothetical protein
LGCDIGFGFLHRIPAVKYQAEKKDLVNPASSVSLTGSEYHNTQQATPTVSESNTPVVLANSLPKDSVHKSAVKQAMISSLARESSTSSLPDLAPPVVLYQQQGEKSKEFQPVNLQAA